MRKLILALLALVFSTLFFSCTDNDLSESEQLYETQATDGEDDETDDGPKG